jgi:hypothetical protein
MARLLQPVAGQGVDRAAEEEGYAQREEDDVEHSLTPSVAAAFAVSLDRLLCR